MCLIQRDIANLKRFIVCLASCLNGVFCKYIERISAELLMEGQNVSKCLCARLPAKKHYSLDTATIVEIGGMRFYILKIRLENLLKPFSWRLRQIASFLSEALCFKNKRAEPRHVTMISHCGILLFINAKVTINARKLTYNCC